MNGLFRKSRFREHQRKAFDADRGGFCFCAACLKFAGGSKSEIRRLAVQLDARPGPEKDCARRQGEGE